MPEITDRVYKSKAGFFQVWKLTASYGIYNQSGVRVGSFSGSSERAMRMACLAADALELEFQW